MVTTDSTEPSSCTDTEDTFGLPPEAHDFETVDRRKVLDISRCECYETTIECRECGQIRYPMRAHGTLPTSDAGIKQALYELYESFYDDPRPIAHIHLIHIAPGEDYGTNIGLADYLADAVDLGADDAMNDRDKKDRHAVLLRVLGEQYL